MFESEEYYKFNNNQTYIHKSIFNPIEDVNITMDKVTYFLNLDAQLRIKDILEENNCISLKIWNSETYRNLVKSLGVKIK